MNENGRQRTKKQDKTARPTGQQQRILGTLFDLGKIVEFVSVGTLVIDKIKKIQICSL